MKKIVSFYGASSDILQKLNQRAKEYAASRGFEYEWAVQSPYNREDVIQRLQDADAGIIDVEPYDEEVFREICGRTRLLVRFGVGYDKVDLEAASQYGIAVARTTGANTLAVAEMALSLILALRRKLPQNHRLVKTRNWKQLVVNETVGSTVGIVGFGAIGQALAGMLKALSCRVLAYDPYPRIDIAEQYGVELVGVEELFRRSDAISLHLPYLEETHHFVNAAKLGLMKPGAVIVNTSRGNIVDEAALYEALSQNKIAGAALDVFAEEPLPETSPLMGLDNILMTPHTSSQTEESLWRIYQLAIDIAADFFQGCDSPHILNGVSYREAARRA